MAVGGSLRAEIERALTGLPARLPGARGRGLPASGQGTGRAGGQAGRPFVLGRSNNGEEVNHVQQS